MRILTIRLTNGSYKPVLLNKSLPVYLIYKFSILYLKSKSYKTQYDYLYSLKLFIAYYDTLGIQIQKELIAGKFQKIFNRLENFIVWLYNKNFNSGTQNKSVSHITYNNHLYRIKVFIEWCYRNYNNNSTPSLKSFQDLFQSYHISINQNPSYKSISNKELNFVLELISPQNENNPFAQRNRLRNYALVSLLMDTGLRLGELLKLKTDDILRDGKLIYLKIIDRNNDLEDNRRFPVQLKNSFGRRVLGISFLTFKALDEYILLHRKRNKYHGYLFTSDRNGNPLSRKSVSKIFNTISNLLELEINPHLLRHNFAERMLRYLIDVKEIEMERAKDELRVLCGWAPNSNMPNLYARNYISELANRHNIERFNNGHD